MLRTTVACFAAGVGGADAVTVLPFDTALGAARRLRPADRPQHPGAAARGVAPRPRLDPAGGSWYVESLTDALAARRVGRFHRDRARPAASPPCSTPGSSPSSSPRPGPARARADRHPPRPDHRGQRVPQPARAAAEPRSPRPTPPRAGRAAAGALRRRCSRRCATAADAAAAAPDGLPGHDRRARPVHRPGRRSPRNLSTPAASTPSRPGGTDADEIAAAFAEAGTTVACSAATDRTTPSTPPRLARRCGKAGATRILAGRAGVEVDGVDGYSTPDATPLAVLRDDAGRCARRSAGMSDPRLRRRRARRAHGVASTRPPGRPPSRRPPASAPRTSRGRRPRASASRRSTPPPTSPTSTSCAPTRASRPTCAARTRRCT